MNACQVFLGPHRPIGTVHSETSPEIITLDEFVVFLTVLMIKMPILNVVVRARVITRVGVALMDTDLMFLGPHCPRRTGHNKAPTMVVTLDELVVFCAVFMVEIPVFDILSSARISAVTRVAIMDTGLVFLTPYRSRSAGHNKAPSKGVTLNEFVIRLAV